MYEGNDWRENAHVDQSNAWENKCDSHLLNSQVTSQQGLELQMYCQPVVPETKLGERLGRYLEERREIDDWILVLQQINAMTGGDPIDEEAQVERLARKLDGDFKRDMGVTPMKKRPKLQVTSPAFEADFDIILAPLNSDLGPEGVKEAIFNSEWKKPVSNVNTLRELVMGAKEMVKKLSTGTKAELEILNIRFQQLQNLAGMRPEDWGTREGTGGRL